MMPVCRAFAKTGQCPNGDKCFMVHQRPAATSLRAPLLMPRSVSTTPRLLSNAALVQMQSSGTWRSSASSSWRAPAIDNNRPQVTTSRAWPLTLSDRIWGPPTVAPRPAALSRNTSTASTTSLAKSDLYKTELCRSWSQMNTCPYGAKCQFAHGAEELRPVQRHPKYKTVDCKQYKATGTCSFGSRCVFVHEESERRVLPTETTASTPAKQSADQPWQPAEIRAPYIHPDSQAAPAPATKRFTRFSDLNTATNTEADLVKRLESAFPTFGDSLVRSPTAADK
ncbi:C3H1-type domain-containing protein [Plasmodiophora brassicae]